VIKSARWAGYKIENVSRLKPFHKKEAKDVTGWCDYLILGGSKV